ncbi:chain-length determining protein [Polaribacter pacificus]|uniref:Chain-length determining protein n=1 Tax=Polaribacter pacificus TaxID=1775173 RepID=A0A917I1J3_9FLAO|nr:Wzz/FepE/Etk N-terminal domain-containing protein [Polaribacter pacificus]GGH01744.1 chain-length determining protein [Polaribacter pacificus]
MKESSNDSNLIDPLDFLRILWKNKKIVIRIVILFALLGLFAAIFTENQYSAYTTMVPQTNEKASVGGNLGGLAAMAGIDLGNMSGESGITPKLYPQILNSIPFQKELLHTPIQFSEGSDKISYFEYYTEVYKPGLLKTLEKYTLGLPGVIITAISSKDKKANNFTLDSTLIRITNVEKILIENINKQINLNVYEKEGYIKISALMPSAISAAEITSVCQNLLQKYIINFKIKKSKSQLDFINDRYLEKEKTFKEAQKTLADYRDKNQNVNSARAQTNLEQLKSDYDLAYGVYAELAKQLEKQQLQVKQDTPVFTVIKPVSVPLEKSEPKRFSVFIGWILLGFFISVVFIFSRIFIINLINKI